MPYTKLTVTLQNFLFLLFTYTFDLRDTKHKSCLTVLWRVSYHSSYTSETDTCRSYSTACSLRFIAINIFTLANKKTSNFNKNIYEYLTTSILQSLLALIEQGLIRVAENVAILMWTGAQCSNIIASCVGLVEAAGDTSGMHVRCKTLTCIGIAAAKMVCVVWWVPH